MDQGQRIAAALAAGILVVVAWILLRGSDRAVEEAFPTLSPAEADSALRDAQAPRVAREEVGAAPEQTGSVDAAPTEPATTPDVLAPSPVETTEVVTLDVRVLRDGAAAPGVTLWIAPPDDWPWEAGLVMDVRALDTARSALTDASGKASFVRLPPARYRLGLGAMQPRTRVTRIVTSPFHAGFAYTVLLGSGRVRGNVYDAEGRARPGVGILVRHRIPDAEHLVIAALATTDAHGAYQLTDFTAGSYEVVLETDRRFDGQGEVEVRRLEIETGSEHVVDFGSPARRLRWSGRVLNAFDEPFPGTGTLRLSQAGSTHSTDFDTDGRFELGFVPGTWELVVYAPGSPGGGFELGPIELPGHDLERDVVVPGARLAGRLVEASGDSTHKGFRVSAREKGHDYPAAFRTVETDSDGAFRIDGLGPGTWLVSVYPGPLAEGDELEVTLAPGERLVEVVLRRAPRGRVLK